MQVTTNQISLSKCRLRLARPLRKGEAVAIRGFFGRKFARWEDFGNVRELLRSEQNEQVSFVVIQQMPELEALLAVASLSGANQRWKRRRAIRRLAGQLAQVTVSIYKTSTLQIDVSNFSRLDPTGNFNLLNSGYYHEGRGLDLDGYDGANPSSWGYCV